MANMADEAVLVIINQVPVSQIVAAKKKNSGVVQRVQIGTMQRSVMREHPGEAHPQLCAVAERRLPGGAGGRGRRDESESLSQPVRDSGEGVGRHAAGAHLRLPAGARRCRCPRCSTSTRSLGGDDGDGASTASLKRWLAYCVCFSFFVLPVGVPGAGVDASQRGGRDPAGIPHPPGRGGAPGRCTVGGSRRRSPL